MCAVVAIDIGWAGAAARLVRVPGGGTWWAVSHGGCRLAKANFVHVDEGDEECYGCYGSEVGDDGLASNILVLVYLSLENICTSSKLLCCRMIMIACLVFALLLVL